MFVYVVFANVPATFVTLCCSSPSTYMTNHLATPTLLSEVIVKISPETAPSALSPLNGHRRYPYLASCVGSTPSARTTFSRGYFGLNGCLVWFA
jgi:hypothetical protein